MSSALFYPCHLVLVRDSNLETVGGGACLPLRESPEPDQDKACVGKRIIQKILTFKYSV